MQKVSGAVGGPKMGDEFHFAGVIRGPAARRVPDPEATPLNPGRADASTGRVVECQEDARYASSPSTNAVYRERINASAVSGSVAPEIIGPQQSEYFCTAPQGQDSNSTRAPVVFSIVSETLIVDASMACAHMWAQLCSTCSAESYPIGGPDALA